MTENQTTDGKFKIGYTGTYFPSEESKEIINIIKTEKADSVTIKEDSKNRLHFEIKVYWDADKPEEFIQKVNKLKELVEKEVLKRV